MSGEIKLASEKYRLLVALRYLNASSAIFEGMKRQCGVNNFHFVITMRSFIEYTRRGIWFLAWADESKLECAEKLTFDKPGSPNLIRMDEMINEALGLGRSSHLLDLVEGVGEPFLNCLHALTHGNPISVRFLGYDLERIFTTGMILLRAETELNLFRTLVYRRALGESLDSVWKDVAPVVSSPEGMKTRAIAAASKLKESGIHETFGISKGIWFGS